MIFLSPGPSFSDERLCDISSESDFINYVENHLGYLYWEESVEPFIDFVTESGLLDATNRVLQDGASKEPMLIGTLKYPFVFTRVLSGLCGVDDANVLGMPHAFEAERDIDCAIKLASGGHYKQSLQTLRSALELSVCHAYFSAAGLNYDELDDILIPPLKDKRRGMINRLLSCRRITQEVAEAISSTYTELSHATHSQYRYLNIKFTEEDESKKFLCVLSNLRVVSYLCTKVVLSAKSISLYTGTTFL